MTQTTINKQSRRIRTRSTATLTTILGSLLLYAIPSFAEPKQTPFISKQPPYEFPDGSKRSYPYFPYERGNEKRPIWPLKPGQHISEDSPYAGTDGMDGSRTWSEEEFSFIKWFTDPYVKNQWKDIQSATKDHGFNFPDIKVSEQENTTLPAGQIVGKCHTPPFWKTDLANIPYLKQMKIGNHLLNIPTRAPWIRNITQWTQNGQPHAMIYVAFEITSTGGFFAGKTRVNSGQEELDFQKNRGIELFGHISSNPEIKFSDTEKDKTEFKPYYNWPLSAGFYGKNTPIYTINDSNSKIGKFWMWGIGNTHFYTEKHGILEEYDSQTGFPHITCNVSVDFAFPLQNHMDACTFGGQLWPGTSSTLYFAMEMLPHLPDIEDCMRKMFEDMSADGKIFQKRERK